MNYDFSVTGSFTKRPDTSQFLGTSFGLRIRAISEYVKFGGESYVLIQGTSGLFSAGASNRALGASSFFSNGSATFFMGGVSAFGGLTGRLSVATFNNISWIGNQWNGAYGTPAIYRYNGSDVSDALMFTPPNAPLAPGGAWYFGGPTETTGSSPVLFATLGGWRWNAAYLSDNNVVGPAAQLNNYFVFGRGLTSISFNIALAVSNAQFDGISYMLIFRDTVGQSAAAIRDGNAPAITTAIWKVPIGNTSPLTLVDSGLGYTSNGFVTYLLSSDTASQFRQNNFYPFGTTAYVVSTGQEFGMINDCGVKLTGFPTILAVYNNMMFYGGFPLKPSHVFWSNLGQPEHVDNENFNEIRTNDGEVVTCLIPYDGQLIGSKRTSLHVITGDDPDTVSFFEKTTQYGFINNQAACVFENLLWGIDGQGKGIVNYNGANTEIISNNVQDIFARINLAAANTEAFMLHVKSRNEVWCGIPVDGSALVNVIIVYDYVAKCWTTFEGLSPTAVTVARGTLSLPRAVMGFSNGTIRYLNPTNAGTEAITTAVRFPFVTNFGWSSTEQYRRLYIDTDPILGTTYTFAVNLYLNQSNTAALQTTMATPQPSITPQQGRIDFGLPGTGLSVELINGSSSPLRVNGYTVESRFQRSV